MDLKLSIGSWNVHGISDKIDDEDFVNIVNSVDIAFFIRDMVYRGHKVRRQICI